MVPWARTAQGQAPPAPPFAVHLLGSMTGQSAMGTCARPQEGGNREEPHVGDCRRNYRPTLHLSLCATPNLHSPWSSMNSTQDDGQDREVALQNSHELFFFFATNEGSCCSQAPLVYPRDSC